MPEKRVTVWVQRFKDRATLMLQWIEPDTGKRKSRSAGTDDDKAAEQARADLEYELNHGRYQEASRMKWERFRELFEAEFVAGRRFNTRNNYEDTLDALERLCRPTTLRGVTERTISAFVTALPQGTRPRRQWRRGRPAPSRSGCSSSAQPSDGPPIRSSFPPSRASLS